MQKRNSIDRGAVLATSLTNLPRTIFSRFIASFLVRFSYSVDVPSQRPE